MAEYPENFAAYPIILADVRSDRTGSGRDWSCRDALIGMLRRIDAGEVKPVGVVVVVIEETTPGRVQTRVSNATRNAFEAAGALASVQHWLMAAD